MLQLILRISFSKFLTGLMIPTVRYQVLFNPMNILSASRSCMKNFLARRRNWSLELSTPHLNPRLLSIWRTPSSCTTMLPTPNQSSNSPLLLRVSRTPTTKAVPQTLVSALTSASVSCVASRATRLVAARPSLTHPRARNLVELHIRRLLLILR